MPKKIDEIDRKILNHLLEEAKIPNYKKLGKALDLAPQTIHNRLKRLASWGVIKGFVPLLDLKKLDYRVTALIQVSAERGLSEALANKYVNHKNVLAIYDILGPYDVLLVTKFHSTEELDRFIKDFQTKNPEVRKTNTISVLNVQKELLLPDLIE